MKVIAFIEQPQGAVIEKILRHCGLWQLAMPKPPPIHVGLSHSVADDYADGPSDSATREVTFVDMDTLCATF
jgi:hypothetical protein